jgi:hypothetical protein
MHIETVFICIDLYNDNLNLFENKNIHGDPLKRWCVSTLFLQSFKVCFILEGQIGTWNISNSFHFLLWGLDKNSN